MSNIIVGLASIISTRNRTYIFIFIFSILKITAAAWFDLGVDEAHYALYAKYVDLSYFDHPPLVGWTHYIFINIFGDNLFGLRISAILLSVVLSLQIYRLLLDYSFSEQAAFWGVAALNSSILLEILGIALLPDTLLIVIIVAIIQCAQNLIETKDIKYYLLLGALFGLAGLAKYTAVLCLISLFAYLIYNKKFEIIFSYKTILAIFIALAIVSPVFIWNYSNNFISLTYQSDHVVGENLWSITTFGISLGRQFLAYYPLLFLIAFYGFFKRLKSADLAVFIGAVTLLFFGYTQGLKLALPHWISPFFAIFIPIGAAILAENRALWAQRTLKISVLSGLSLSVILYLELIFKIGSFPDFKNPFQDIHGWRMAGRQAALLAKQNGVEILGVPNWTMASRVQYYSGLPVMVLQDKKTQFDFWVPNAKEMIVVIDKFSNMPTDRCKKHYEITELNATMNGSLVNTFKFYYCERNQ